MPKGPSTSQYMGGIVADQLSKMAATIIGSTEQAKLYLTIVQLEDFVWVEALRPSQQFFSHVGTESVGRESDS